MGIPTDDIEARGRWRSAKRQVNTYIAIQIPVLDATVASCLCGPTGPVMYRIRSEFSGCTDSFLLSVAPGAREILTPEIAIVLAKTLLYAAIQDVSAMDGTFKLMPDSLRHKLLNLMRTAGNYESIDEIRDVIERVPVVVSGSAGQLNFVELGLNHTTGAPLGPSAATSTGIATELAALTSTVLGVKRRLEEINSNHQNSLMDMRSEFEKSLRRIHTSIKRIALQPVVRRAADAHTEHSVPVDPVRVQAKLTKRPSDLFALWNEYEHGVGGCKPARQFTAAERGQVKWMYSFRLCFWQLVDTMTRRGHTSETAIDAVYAAYGRSKPVSDILRAIRQDKKRGGHPNLR